LRCIAPADSLQINCDKSIDSDHGGVKL